MGVPVRPDPGIAPGELRGWAARKNLAEDARWAMDTRSPISGKISGKSDKLQ
jgi:hypothetical protein